MSLNRVALKTFCALLSILETRVFTTLYKIKAFFLFFFFIDPLWRTTTLTWKWLWAMVIWAFLLTFRHQRQETLDFSQATHTALLFFRWDIHSNFFSFLDIYCLNLSKFISAPYKLKDFSLFNCFTVKITTTKKHPQHKSTTVKIGHERIVAV